MRKHRCKAYGRPCLNPCESWFASAICRMATGSICLTRSGNWRSRLADERLWAEVLNLGWYDVLATPFDADEVYRVMSYAVDSWHCQVVAGAKYAPAP